MVICTAEQKQELEQIRDSHEKAYLRERTAAILKIAAGQRGRQVALKGLLKRRKPATLYEWVKRYQNEEVAGFFPLNTQSLRLRKWPCYTWCDVRLNSLATSRAAGT